MTLQNGLDRSPDSLQSRSNVDPGGREPTELLLLMTRPLQTLHVIIAKNLTRKHCLEGFVTG